uniref:Laminin N-terminal domain-containing protein n=1 Tax=Parascaris equorum TaxID=6256 RepID=A0A914RWV8_PAREQ
LFAEKVPHRSLNADEYYQDSYQEFASSEERGLFPNIFNLATNALIWADATCGQHHREVYCKLVEHVFNRSLYLRVCGTEALNEKMLQVISAPPHHEMRIRPVQNVCIRYILQRQQTENTIAPNLSTQDHEHELLLQ